jgi:hypothetical protein
VALLRPHLAEGIRKNMSEYEDGQQLVNGLLSPKIKLIIDRDYPYAKAIRNLESMIDHFLNCPWTIIRNVSSKAFVTSDNPAILIYYPERWYADTYIALSPTLSLLIHMVPYEKFCIKSLKFSIVRAEEETVEKLNCEIIKFAEDKVVANVKADWITNKVLKYKDWRVETKNESFYKFSERSVDNSKN